MTYESQLQRIFWKPGFYQEDYNILCMESWETLIWFLIKHFFKLLIIPPKIPF